LTINARKQKKLRSQPAEGGDRPGKNA